MSSPLLTALSSYGITQGMLTIGFVLFGVAMIIGMYWELIVPGAAVLLGIYLVFGLPDKEPDKPEAKPNVKEEVIFDEYAAYMEDCVTIAQYKRSKCEKLWLNREDDEPEVKVEKTSVSIDMTPKSHVQLIDVDNVEYKKRRTEAIAKPNAIVFHETLR